MIEDTKHEGGMSMDDAFAMAGIRGLLYLAAMEGLDIPKTLAVAGVTNEEFNDSEAMISVVRAESLARSIEAGLSKGNFFRAMSRVKLGDFGVHGYAIRHSKTLGESLSLQARYHHLANRAMDSHFEINTTEATLSLSYEHAFEGAITRITAESWAVLGLILMRSAVEGELTPLCVGFPYAKPVYSEELETILRCPLRFSSPSTFISFSLKDIERPIAGADSMLQGVVMSHCESMLSKLTPQGGAFSTKVRKLLVPLFQHGTPSIDDVAKRLGMSPRTFQRRLGDEDTSFRELVEKTQEELAFLYLKQPYVTVSELAYLLGFSTHAAFHKAFRRWTNETPGDYRKRHLAVDTRIGQ